MKYVIVDMRDGSVVGGESEGLQITRLKLAKLLKEFRFWNGSERFPYHIRKLVKP